MTAIAEKALKQLYDEYLCTGVNDWKCISTVCNDVIGSIELA